MGQCLRKGGLPVSWLTGEQNPTPWLEIIGSQEVMTVLLFDKLLASSDHAFGQYQILKGSPRCKLEEEVMRERRGLKARRRALTAVAPLR